MRSLIAVVLSAALIAIPHCTAFAEEKVKWKADPSRGQELSDRLCATCHFVRAEGRTDSVVAGVPSFRAIAELPDERISNSLMVSHMPMPNMQLTRNEIADILAYFDELRRKAKDAPSAPATRPREEPKIPSRS
jgi:mono/diheme cytochrome c family protein